jgi:LAO/AO transport system kinase
MDNLPRDKPAWVPAGAGAEYATTVVGGVVGGHDGLPGGGAAAYRPVAGARAGARRRELTVDAYVAGIVAGDRSVLAQAITLVESNAGRHQALAGAVMAGLAGRTGGAVRIGITGVPGAGKSTLIEALGEFLCGRGHRVAVLAVDPSSTVTRGSILGDKTRMERLARNPAAFIRPSPTGGTLGGVARKSRETMLLCEAFGFDVILLETVGVGQSEVTVRSMVDCFVLVQIAGAGDELQGIKKGVVELADLVLVNKADGANETAARLTAAEFNRVLPWLHAATEGWKSRAQTVSALTGAGIGELWQTLEQFLADTRATGVHQRRREAQNLEWMQALIDEGLRARFYCDPAVAAALESARRSVAAGLEPVARAVERILAAYDGGGVLGRTVDAAADGGGGTGAE